MTDGISEGYRAQRDYQEWDAPHCYVCAQKYEPEKMQRHIEGHSVKAIVDALVSWSVSSWEREKERGSK